MVKIGFKMVHFVFSILKKNLTLQGPKVDMYFKIVMSLF